MYQTLTFYHSIFRWIVLISLIYSIIIAYRGYKLRLSFNKSINKIRHWTATFAHIQMVIGIILYSQSPITKYFWSNTKVAISNLDFSFFALIHLILMIISITLITIGSSLTKRKLVDNTKFKTMLIWYSIALLLILIAIPWPFSPLASRPYLR